MKRQPQRTNRQLPQCLIWCLFALAIAGPVRASVTETDLEDAVTLMNGYSSTNSEIITLSEATSTGVNIETTSYKWGLQPNQVVSRVVSEGAQEFETVIFNDSGDLYGYFPSLDEAAVIASANDMSAVRSALTDGVSQVTGILTFAILAESGISTSGGDTIVSIVLDHQKMETAGLFPSGAVTEDIEYEFTIDSSSGELKETKITISGVVVETNYTYTTGLTAAQVESQAPDVSGYVEKAEGRPFETLMSEDIAN